MADIKQIEAVVFNQFSLKWQEIGKASVIAGITATLSLLGQSIYGGTLPTTQELKVAGMVGLTTMLGALIKYFTQPTVTVVKGIEKPAIDVNEAGKVEVKEIAIPK